MTESFAPRRVSDEVKTLSLTGYLLPMDKEGRPVFVTNPSTPDLFIFVFSTEEKLTEYLGAAGIAYDRIKEITNGGEFLDSIPYRNPEDGTRLRIGIDPWVNEAGNTRYIGVLREDG